MADKKNCFIIMPVTTPKELISKYRDDSIHFDHVLDHLFIPAIEKAGFNPIKPIAEGADNIPAEIINNLDSSELVFCDFSTFNPNVFFELGIRTALDKPVCLVKDELAPKIPFDVSIINCYTYKSTLEHWNMEKEIKDLSKHIKSSLSRSNEENPLWKYFGIRTSAKSPEEGSEKDKFDLILNRLDDLYQHNPSPLAASATYYTIDKSLEDMYKALPKMFRELINNWEIDDDNHIVTVDTTDNISLPIKAELEDIISMKLKYYGFHHYKIKFKEDPPIKFNKSI